MIALICTLIGTVLAFSAIWYGSWAMTYLRGPKEDGEWLDYVLKRTKHGYIFWEVDKGKHSEHKELKGKDGIGEEFHELSIHDKNARFLRSYSMKGQEDDGYTYNKPQLATINIKPWRPMNRLVKAALKQIEARESGKVEPPEPWPDPPEPVKPLFNLGWGEEPKWNKEEQ